MGPGRAQVGSARLSTVGLTDRVRQLSCWGGPLAHPEEQGTFNPKVPGSRPGRPTGKTQPRSCIQSRLRDRHYPARSVSSRVIGIPNTGSNCAS